MKRSSATKKIETILTQVRAAVEDRAAKVEAVVLDDGARSVCLCLKQEDACGAERRRDPIAALAKASTSSVTSA